MNFGKACSDLRNFVVNPEKRFGYLTELGLTNRMNDEEFLKKKFKLKLGYDLNLENPSTFNEKLQWLKIHDRKPEYTMMVDKYKVRSYIADKIGYEYLIPLIGVWDKPEQIDFNALPSQFVLKCNHNSGVGMCICKDKAKLNVKKVKHNLQQGLNENYYLKSREWPYKNVPRKIICEKYMKNDKGVDGVGPDELSDYKCFCFNGTFDSVMVCTGRSSGHTQFRFYDREWKRIRYMKPELEPVGEIKRPVNLSQMVGISEILSKGHPFMRVDLYVVNEQIYFGELTFFDDSGFDSDITFETDKQWGNLIDLEMIKE